MNGMDGAAGLNISPPELLGLSHDAFQQAMTHSMLNKGATEEANT